MHSVLDAKINKTHAKRAFSASLRKEATKKEEYLAKSYAGCGKADMESDEETGDEEDEEGMYVAGKSTGRATIREEPEKKHARRA